MGHVGQGGTDLRARMSHLSQDQNRFTLKKSWHRICYEKLGPNHGSVLFDMLQRLLTFQFYWSTPFPERTAEVSLTIRHVGSIPIVISNEATHAN